MRFLIAALLFAATTAHAAPSGVYALGYSNQPVSQAIVNLPAVNGITLQAMWSDVEPKRGVYSWALFDAGIAQAKAAGKHVMLEVAPGYGSPAWLYPAAHSISLAWWIPSWGPKLCSAITVPLPWDNTYLAAWTQFVEAMGARYGSNPTVVGIKLAGTNVQTGEQVLPWASQAAVCPGSPDPLTAWQAAGYQPQLLEQAWDRILVVYASAFPHTTLVLQTGGWGMPPIDDNGKLTAATKYGDTALTQALAAQASTVLGSRFMVANNGWTAHFIWPEFPALKAAHVPVGTQEGAPVTPNCARDWGSAPCTAAETMAAMSAHAPGFAYIEVYQPDLTNAVTGPAVALMR
jgi:hypothetical protein